MLDIKSNTISIRLSEPIEISKDGGLSKESEVVFKQPNRFNAAKFETLVNLQKNAFLNLSKAMGDLVSEEEREEAKAKEQAKKEKGSKLKPKDELEAITYESIMEDVASNLDLVNTLNFDFEKAYKIFEKMLVAEGGRSICSIGGLPFVEKWLDLIDYRDFKFMLITYITFFGRSVKSDTASASSQQSDSHTDRAEL